MASTPVARPQARTLFGAIVSRLVGVALAVLLSFTLWVLIVNQQNPEVTEEFAQPIQVEVAGLPPDLLVASELPQVRLVVTTPQDHRARLRAGSFRAWVDLRDAARGAREFTIQYQSTDRQAKIESVTPSVVTVRLDAIGRKEVPVRAAVSGRPSEGYTAGDREPRVSPDRVVVTGAQSLLETVEAVEVIVRLDGARDSISQSLRPQPVNAAGAEVRNVQVSPQSVLVELAIERQFASKVIPVRTQLVGTVRQGYQIVSIDVNPPAVAVVGDPTVIEPLTSLTTAGVDVRNSVTDIIQPVDVVLPAGVSMVRREQVTVHVGIRALEGSQTLRIAPVAQNVPEGFEAEFARPSVSVTLAGPEPTLAALPPEEVRVAVDLTDVLTGTHTITPTVSVPAPLRVISLDPPQLTVTVRPLPEGAVRQPTATVRQP